MILCLVVILNVGRFAPKFKMGFTVMLVLSVCKFAMIFVIKVFVNRDRKRAALAESGIGQTESDHECRPVVERKKSSSNQDEWRFHGVVI